ncbi:hypothetical protein PVAND_009972 [Polypedilum vanderplanki]|uniref:CRAL-TRIO domain-containing protein n=1 Tax=Polypedilum vanderplanki TaxID=319348 RepID=A0A9J6CF81_POLVA|nr:hypothetical protein PVAND_009972 [Polypedilum vanderplanki]
MSFKKVILSENEMDEKVAEFRKWIKEQPQLPQNIEKMLLLRYLKTYNFNLERAQKLIAYSFDIRAKNQHIFTDRDPESPALQNVLNVCEIVPMSKATSDNYKVCILRLIDYDSRNFVFNDVVKAFFTFADLRLVSPDPNPELADGEIPIFDMKGLSIWHLFKINFATLKLYFKYVQEAHPVRVQQCHIVNCTPLLSRVMSLVRPLLKPEVAARLQFHSPNSDTIFKFIPRDILPEEYGGTAGSIVDMKEHWFKKLLAKRDYLRNDSNWIISKIDDNNNNIIDNEFE